MCTVLLTPGDNPIAVNKHIISYQRICLTFITLHVKHQRLNLKLIDNPIVSPNTPTLCQASSGKWRPQNQGLDNWGIIWNTIKLDLHPSDSQVQIFQPYLNVREERRLRVFEYRVLRKVFGPKRDEVTGEWRKLHNEELRDLYSLPNIVREVNREEWDGRGIWRVWGRGGVCTGFWWVNLRERDHWGDPDVDGRIILRWIFRKWEGWRLDEVGSG